MVHDYQSGNSVTEKRKQGLINTIITIIRIIVINNQF